MKRGKSGIFKGDKNKKGNLVKSKNAQQLFGMSFSFIISLILIAVFITVAFFAIRHFLDLKKCEEIGFFIEDLENAVENAYSSQSTEKSFGDKSNLPEEIENICFADLNGEQRGPDVDIYNELLRKADYNANLFFYPSEKTCIPSAIIEKIDMQYLLDQENPFCFPVNKGKVHIIIIKDFYDRLVKLDRPGN